jgi:hypothetical protein
VFFLRPHCIAFAVLDFPADPDAQAASRLRPPGIAVEDVDPRMYDHTFAWTSLGFQHTSGPYPLMLLDPPTGKMLSCTLQHRAWVVPLWIFLLLFAFIPNLYLIAILRRRSRCWRSLCVTCGYDLRVHKPGERCPECGTLIPDSQAATIAGKSKSRL